MLGIIKEDESIRSIKGLFLRRMENLPEKKIYSSRRWNDWRRRFFDDEEIAARIDMIDAILEERMVEGCLTGALNGQFGKFAMVNRHGWRDKSEVDANVNGNISLVDLAREAENEDE